MPSLIPGYNYDIFISYRQKDNKYDGWVTEFVDNLKKELEATFKEEISVYFDINPHDGLLETHDVDASLKDKLKCLVFIPIISRTYCDPKSFAWEHEFKAFVEQASKDKFGLKIKLPNGNVASRVLPIRIHDLDQDDIKECESVLGGVLRGIEFIYKEAGVDKPLAPDDDEKKNLNNTKYRIQIIKVAHAIKEIILGMKIEPVLEVKEKDQPKESFKEVREDERRIDLEKPPKTGKNKLLSTITILAILIVAGILAYPKIFKKNTLDKLRSSGERISIAVMPFQNLTNDTIVWNDYQEIIQNNLTSYLSNYSTDLQIRQTESINSILNSEGLKNYASITPSFASKTSKKLNVDVFIYGNIIKSGNTIRLSAQIIDSETGEIIKPFKIEGRSNEGNLLPKIDALSRMVKDFLVLSKLEKEGGKAHTADILLQGSTNSPEAYKYFIYGMNAPDNKTKIDWFKKAISVDSTFVLPYMWIARLYRQEHNISLYDSAKKWCLKIYKKRDQVPLMQQLMIKSEYAFLFENQVEQNKYLMQILNIDDQQPLTYYFLGANYYDMTECDKAIPALGKGIEVYEKWGVKPSWLPSFYYYLFSAYFRSGRYEEEKKVLQEFQKDFPDSDTINFWHVILSFKEEDTVRGNRYVEKWLFIEKKKTVPEETIIRNLGVIYSWGGIPDKAKECCRKLLSLQSVSVSNLNWLAWVLVEDDRTTNEALELAERALELYPENHIGLHRKG